MDEFSAGVSDTTPVSSDSSSGSMAGDTAGQMGADAGSLLNAVSTEPTNDTEQQLGSDAAASDAAESALPMSEEEIAGAPDQWREKLGSVLSWGKGLESDLKELKAVKEQWGGLAEFGDPQTITDRLKILDGLGAYATDEQGQVLVDANGLPCLTTKPFLETVAQQGDGLAEQLAVDIWNQTRADGLTYGQWYLKQLGLDPARIQEYAGIDALKQSQQVKPEFSDAEFIGIDDGLHETYRQLSAIERNSVQDALDKSQHEEVRKYLQGKQAEFQEREESRQFREQMAMQADQQKVVETQQFWQGVEANVEQTVTKANTEILGNLHKQISSQVTFSADPVTNAFQTNAATALVAAMASPVTRFAVQPILEALKITVDPQIDALSVRYMQAVKSFETFRAAKESANPRFASLRNDLQMQNAQREMGQIQQQAMAKLMPAALKFAKLLAGGNQELREASSEQLAGIRSRPAVGNGQAAGGQARYAPQPNRDPFSVDFFQAA